MPQGGIESMLTASMHARLKQMHQTHHWEMQLLRWCMHDPVLRTQMLRFIDCLPALKSPSDIVRHLREYFPPENRRLPAPLRVGLLAARPGLFTQSAVASVTRRAARSVARLFLAGSNPVDAFSRMRALEQEGFRISVDLLGEATTSDAEADRYAQRYIELMRDWRANLRSAPHVSLKLSSLAFPFEPVDPDGAYVRILPRLRQVLASCDDPDAFVNVDMEQYRYRDLVLEVVRRALDEQFPREHRIGIVVQAYLRDAEESARRFLKWAARRKIPVGVRLVRGAYWDTEVIAARQNGWPVPVFAEKGETDACYERLTDLLFEHHEFVRVAIATHNLRSIAHAIAKAKELGVPQDRWECQVLYGVGEPVQHAVKEAGVPVRVYSPVGELIPGMAYLVRRILENTSQTSFLAVALLSDGRREAS